MFEEPWKRKRSDTVVDAAIEDSERKPWDPPLPNVAPEIIQAHRTSATARGEGLRVDRLQAQAFAKELIIDFNPVKALLRLGWAKPDASTQALYKKAQRYERDPYVQQAMRDYIHRIESDKIVSRERILYGLLEEACYHGPGASASARVAAWGQLTKLMGMHLPPDDPAKAQGVRGGVLLIPYSPSVEDWERNAMGQQAKLKADVRA